MNREEILLEIRDALLRDIQKTLEKIGLGDMESEDTKKCVTQFVSSKAMDLNDEELLTQFGDKMKVIGEYITFLETEIQKSGFSIH